MMRGVTARDLALALECSGSRLAIMCYILRWDAEARDRILKERQAQALSRAA